MSRRLSVGRRAAVVPRNRPGRDRNPALPVPQRHNARRSIQSAFAWSFSSGWHAKKSLNSANCHESFKLDLTALNHVIGFQCGRAVFIALQGNPVQ